MSLLASTIFFAAAAMLADVFVLVVGEPVPGLSGSGGGARSGSELSHLRASLVSAFILELPSRRCYTEQSRDLHTLRLKLCEGYTYMGTLIRPLASDQEC